MPLGYGIDNYCNMVVSRVSCAYSSAPIFGGEVENVLVILRQNNSSSVSLFFKIKERIVLFSQEF